MTMHDPNPLQPPAPEPGEAPAPVRDDPIEQPNDPLFPPDHAPEVDPDNPEPGQIDPPGPRGPQTDY